MWLPSLALGRLLTFAAIGLAAVAVALGRRSPPPPDLRRPAIPRYRPIRSASFPTLAPGVSLLDTETGTVVRFPLSGNDLMLGASCSPWRDARGRTHVAGLWREHDGFNPGKSGLAHGALPGAKVLDRIELAIVPNSPPCWPPSIGAWVLYAGTDGLLYRLSFDEFAKEARPLAWRCPLPRGGRVLIEDPTWPSDPRLAATIVVTLRKINAVDNPVAWEPLQLWWLKLNPDGTAIEAAGRLIAGAPRRGEEIVTECRPALSATPDGGLALAYLARRRDESEYKLRLATVDINAVTGVPRVEGTEVVELTGDRATSPPAFSRDGRWVYSFPSHPDLPIRAQRHSVDDALAGRRGPEAAYRPSGVARSAR